MKTYRGFLVWTVVLLIALGGQIAMAQSTIFNIPTTDTVAKGKAGTAITFSCHGAYSVSVATWKRESTSTSRSWEKDNATRNRYLFVYYGVTF